MYDAIMAEANGESLSAKHLGRELARTLRLYHRQIKRGRATHKSIVDMDSTRWKRRASTIPENAIGVGEHISLYYKIRF